MRPIAWRRTSDIVTPRASATLRSVSYASGAIHGMRFSDSDSGTTWHGGPGAPTAPGGASDPRPRVRQPPKSLLAISAHGANPFSAVRRERTTAGFLFDPGQAERDRGPERAFRLAAWAWGAIEPSDVIAER